MELKEILENKELAILKKKSEIQKMDFSNVLFDEIQKAISNSNEQVEVLVYDAIIKKDRNEEMFKQYQNNWVLNHSVGMRYVKLLLCVNSDEPDYSQEKENFNKYYPLVLNKESVQEYFWAILEAKNIEASAVVKGSNFLTPVLLKEIIDENTIRVKLAISPSNIIDSHKDVHFPSIWKKTLNENPYDILLQEHDMDFDKVIVDSITGTLKVYTEMISIKELMSKFKKANKSEPLEDTQKDNEPSNDTQEEQPIKTNKKVLFNL